MLRLCSILASLGTVVLDQPSTTQVAPKFPTDDVCSCAVDWAIPVRDWRPQAYVDRAEHLLLNRVSKRSVDGSSLLHAALSCEAHRDEST
jgi:hypothetical protein